MSASPRHGRNLLWLFLAEGYQKLIALALFVYISYKLTPEENGWYAAYAALWPVLVAAINLGASDIVTREIAQQRAAGHRFVSAGWALQCVAAIPVAIVLFLILRAGDYPRPLEGILLLAAFASFVTTLSRTTMAVFAGYEQFKFISIAVMFTRTFAVGGSLALLYFGYGVGALVIFLAPVAAVQFVINGVIASRRFGKLVTPFDRRDTAFLIRQGVPVALSGVAATAFFASDMFIVIGYGGEEIVGQYGFAMRFILMLFTVSDVLESVFYPVMSRAALESFERRCFVAAQCLKASLLIAVPIAFGGVVLAAPIVELLGGAKFAGAVPALRGLLIVLAIEFANRTLATLLRAERMQRISMVAYGGAATLKIVLGPWSLVTYGLTGLVYLNGALAASVLVLEGCAATYQLGWPFLRQAVFGSALRPLLAAAGMAVALMPLRELPVFATIPIGVAVFVALGFVTRAIDPRDRALLFSAQR